MKNLLGISSVAVIHFVLIATSHSQKTIPESQGKYLRNAAKGEFPFVVFVQRNDTEETFCAGSLITPNTVLTSAFCLLRNGSGQSIVFPEHIRVHAGVLNLVSSEEEDNRDRQTREAKQILMSWDIFRNDTFLRDEIALVILKEMFKMTAAVKTIPLPNANFTAKVKTESTHVGWGNMGDVLKRATFSLEKIQVCGAHDHFAYHNREFKVLCAKGSDKRICTGDEGGPLLVKDGWGNWVLYGVAYRSGETCENQPPSPAEFANIPQYATWIKTVTKRKITSASNNNNKLSPHILMASLAYWIFRDNLMI